MPTDRVIDFDYAGTDKFLYRTYEMVLGGNAKTPGQKYYGAIQAQILSPEVWETKSAFDGAIPYSAKNPMYSALKVDSTWTASATQPADAAGAATGVWVTNTAAGSKNNQITASVNNGDSFVVAIDHDLGTVTW